MINVKKGQKGIERKYGYEDQVQAAMWYLLTGSLNKAAQKTGISRRRLQDWAKTPEWDQILEEVRRKQGAKLDASLSKIIQLAHGNIVDRLQNGDAVVGAKGAIVRKPVSARDSMMIAAIAQDKQALVRGKPQRITASDTSLEKLKEGLRKISQEEEEAVRKQEEELVKQVLGEEK